MKKRKKYEGSKADRMADAREAKKRGMTQKQWENSPEDKAMDRRGQAAMVGRNEFSPDEEQAMRRSARDSRMAPPMPDTDMDGM